MDKAEDRLAEAFTAHGHAVNRSAGYWVTTCPVHNDNHPSVSFTRRRKDDGVVVACGAQCDTGDILAAIGLQMSDLFDNDTMRNVWNPNRDYTYSDGRTVKRREGKNFSQSGNTRGKALFHVELIEDAGTVYVPEGEKDVEAIEAVGGAAVCNAMGAGKAHLFDWTPLKGKHAIVIRDKDPNGTGQKHAAEVCAILDDIAASVKIVEAAVGKDAAEHLAADKHLDEFVEIPNPLLAQLKSAADLDTREFAPLVFHVPSLIPEGFSILAGSPKIGKSWLTLAIALACAQGGRVLGSIKVDPRPVLLLALEDGERRLQDRMRKLNGDVPIPANLTYSYAGSITRGQELATIKAWLKQHRGRNPLVILDTLAYVLPQHRPGESVYLSDYDGGLAVKRLVDAVPGAAIVAVHHDRKATAEDWVKTLSGSQGITGSADHVLLLTRKRNSEEGMLSVTSREAPEGQFALCMAEGIWTLDGGGLGIAAERAREREQRGDLGERQTDVLAFVNSRAETKAVDVVEALGMNRATVDTCLSRLAEKDRIQKIRRGVYGPASTPPLPMSEETEVLEEPPLSDTSISSDMACVMAESPTCRSCQQPLMHPESVERGYCQRPQCLLAAEGGEK